MEKGVIMRHVKVPPTELLPTLVNGSCNPFSDRLADRIESQFSLIVESATQLSTASFLTVQQQTTVLDLC